MTTVPISDGIPKNNYTATAGQTIFPYTFWVREEAHIAVYVNGTLKALSTDYTISGIQSTSGANIVFNAGLAEDDLVALIYDPEIERQSEFTGTIRLDALNTDLTYLTTVAQSNKRISEGSIRISDSDPAAFDGAMPTLMGNGGRVMGLKSDLSGVEFVTLASGDAIISNYEEGVFNGTGAQTAFTLPFTPTTQNALLVWEDDVRLRPGTDYTISGTTLTFAVAPTSGTANVVYLNTSATTSVNTPADGSVTTAKLAALAVTSATVAANAITTAKVTDNAITLAKLADGTQGDILYYGASGAPALLGAGSAGQVLQSGGAGANPSWQTADTVGISNKGYADNRYYFGMFYASTNTNKAVTAGRHYFRPLVITESVTFTRVGVNVDASAAGNVRMGLYSLVNGVPVTLITDFGEISAASTGDREATISETIAPGTYAVTCLFSATPAVKSLDFDIAANEFLGGTGSSTTATYFGYNTQAYGALPSSFGGSITYDNSANSCPTVWFRKV